MSITLSYLAPIPELRSSVRNFIFLQGGDSMRHVQNITPSPYCYLSFSIGCRPQISLCKQPVNTPFELTGPKLRSDIEVFYSGKFEQLLVEFTLFGFYRLFGVSPYSFVNKTIETTVLKKSPLFELLCNIKTENQTIEAVYRDLETCFKHAAKFDIPAYLIKGESIIHDHVNSANLPDSREFQTGMRNLSRNFKKYAGIGPKHYHQLLKLHKATHYFVKQIEVNDTAFETGFYDVSHFHKFFLKQTEYTPASFRNSIEKMPVKRHYFQKVQ